MADKASDKLKAIDTAVTQIERQFGKGSIMRLGQREALAIPHLPTGSLAVDYALGVGGVPRGRVVEIYGPESSGKTTLALHVVAQAQKRGGVAAFIDAEHALDPEYAGKLGVDVDNLLISQPDYRRAGPGDRRDADASGTPSMWSSSTRWPPWCRGPSSKARWATPMSACRRGSCPRPCAS